MNDHQKASDDPRGWQPRFGIGALFLVTLVFCVVAAAGSYLARSIRDGDTTGRLVFVFFIMAGPALLLVAVSLFRSLAIRISRRNNRKR